MLGGLPARRWRLNKVKREISRFFCSTLAWPFQDEFTKQIAGYCWKSPKTDEFVYFDFWL